MDYAKVLDLKTNTNFILLKELIEAFYKITKRGDFKIIEEMKG